MPKQESILPIRGSLGDVTYYKREGKYFCKKKNTVSLEQLRTDAAFAPFRRQGQISSRCITLAAAIYKLAPADKRNGKLYRSMIKWICKPHHHSKDLDTIINQAILEFNFKESEFPMPEMEECIRQVRSALPFTKLLPDEAELLVTPAPKPPSTKKSVRNISFSKDVSLNKDLHALIAAIQQLTAALAEKLVDH